MDNRGKSATPEAVAEALPLGVGLLGRRGRGQRPVPPGSPRRSNQGGMRRRRKTPRAGALATVVASRRELAGEGRVHGGAASATPGCGEGVVPRTREGYEGYEGEKTSETAPQEVWARGWETRRARVGEDSARSGNGAGN